MDPREHNVRFLTMPIEVLVKGINEFLYRSGFDPDMFSPTAWNIYSENSDSDGIAWQHAPISGRVYIEFEAMPDNVILFYHIEVTSQLEWSPTND